MDNPLIQPDPGLYIWTIVTFLVLLGLLAKYAWRPLLQALEQRQASIRKSLDDAQQAKMELERLQQESVQIIREARVEAEKIVSNSRSYAEKLQDEIKQKARADAEVIVANAERQIQLETRRALDQIRVEAADLSVMIASKLIQRNLSKEDNARLIEEALHQVEGRLHDVESGRLPVRG
jgi:F-type H+-transporting ATPase subunit b